MDLTNMEKKIIYHLDKNVRSPLTKLSKITQINRNTLEYNIKKLINNEIIQGFYIHPNKIIFDKNYYKYFIKLKKSHSNFNIFDLFKEPSIAWIGKSDGLWDYIFTIKIKNKLELKNIINKINNKLVIKNKCLTIVKSALIFNEKWASPKEEPKYFKSSIDSKKYEFDKIEKIIIKELEINSRISLLKLSEKIKIAPETVRRKLKNINKYIIYKSRINYRKIGFDYYHILISLNDLKIKDKIIIYLLNSLNCVSILEYIGKYDLHAELIAKSYEEIIKIIDDLKNNYFEYIEDIERLFIIENTNIKI